MSSALCEEVTERIADEQNRLNKKADAPRTQAACLDSCRPTSSEIVIVRRRLKRRYVLPFFQKLPPCLFSSKPVPHPHHWSRELQALDPRERLMPPAHVKPYVKRQKTDAAPHLLSVNPGGQSPG